LIRVAGAGWALALWMTAAPAFAQNAPEAKDMALVGYNDTQGRSAYQPVIHEQFGRWIAYTGHHGGTDAVPNPKNPLTGAEEANGTSIVDIRDPYHPTEVAYYIPPVTENTDKRCIKLDNGEQRCKVAIQTNNVEVDDRGYIYIVDRANTGLHILELTGDARKIANFPK
jgi:hypothetical protein